MTQGQEHSHPDGEIPSSGYPPVPDNYQESVPTKIPVKLPDVKPYVTNILIGFTVFVFLLQQATDYLISDGFLAFYGAKINSLIAQGQIWRLFTPMFLHGNLLHIAFNMYALSKIGPSLERFYGHWRYVALYILAGFGGNVFSMIFTEAASLGSSTAIFGLIAAQGVFYYQNREIFGSTFKQALNGIITIAVINLLIGMSPGIDNWGHVGGLVSGVIFSWVGGPVIEVRGIYPSVVLADKREPNEVIQAIGLVVLFFGILAVGALYLMS